MDDPKYPPPRFAVPIERALYSESLLPDGTRRIRYMVNDQEVPEEIFAAAVADLGSQWPLPGPVSPNRAGRVCLFRRRPGPALLQGTYWANRFPIDTDSQIR